MAVDSFVKKSRHVPLFLEEYISLTFDETTLNKFHTSMVFKKTF